MKFLLVAIVITSAGPVRHPIGDPFTDQAACEHAAESLTARSLSVTRNPAGFETVDIGPMGLADRAVCEPVP
jgi:hypothetical protein